MRQAFVSGLKEGDVLARPIFSSNGNILLGKDIVLTPNYIKRLEVLGITTVYIEDELFEDIMIDDILSDQTRLQAIKVTRDCLDMVKMGKDFDGTNIKIIIEGLLEEILSKERVLFSLNDIFTRDDRVFSHSLNVCILSIIIGIDYRLNKEKLFDLAIGALLHDVGLACLGPEVIQNKDLSAKENARNYQHHCLLGFNLLRKKREFSLLSSHVALQHHERLDGQGYPRGLKGKEVLFYPRIVSICNIYNNLIQSDQNLLPHEACEVVMGLCGRYFDQEILRHFLRNVAIYPTGVSVRLNTGEVGVVVDQNLDLPQRPVVRVIREETEEKVARVLKEYDLVQDTTVFIEDVVR